MTIRRALLVAVLAATSVLAEPARADTTEQCVRSATEADRLRREPMTLRAAREALLVCTRDDCPAVIRNDCRGWLAELDTVIPTVILLAEDSDGTPLLEVRAEIDDVPLEQPLDGRPVRLDAGMHVFRFSYRGQRIERKAVVVARQKDEVVRVRFDVGAAAPAVPPLRSRTLPNETTQRPEPPRSSPLPIIGLGTAAAGVVALGLGAFFGLRAASKQEDARCPDNVCGLGSDPEALRDAKQLGNTSTAFFIAGGILTAGGLSLALFSRSSRSAHTPAATKPAAEMRVSPYGVGLRLEVRTF